MRAGHLVTMAALLAWPAVCGAQAVVDSSSLAPSVMTSTPSVTRLTGAYPTTATSNAYPKGDFYAQLSSASGDAPQACEWGWGCGGSPFRPGPGECDNWRVGPKWDGRVDGVFLTRDAVDVAALSAAADAGGAAIPIGAGTLTGNFEHGAGVRMSLTGRMGQGLGCSGSGYEVQVGYLGIFEWDAGAFNPDVPPPGPIAAQPDLTLQRSLSYRSSLHSLEFNGQTVGSERLKLFGGVRYVRLSEDVDDLYDESSPTPSLSNVATADLELTDILRNVAVNNNLIGFQGGLRSDLFRVSDRFYLSGFANAGAYCNLIRRSTAFEQTDTFFRADDPLTAANEALTITQSTSSGYKSDRARFAFLSEASLSAVYQVNRCTSAQLGYQVLYLSGVELGDEAFLAAGPTSADLLLHGWFAGVEYRR